MEARHEMTAHIRKNRTVFLQIGMLISLLVVFGAFRWTTYGETVRIYEPERDTTIDVGLWDVKIEEEKKLDLFKEKSQPKPSERFKLVDDKFKIVDTATLKTNPVPDPFTTGIIKALADSLPPEIIPGDDDNNIHPTAQVMATYPGGEEAMKKFIKDNFLVPYDLQVSGASVVLVQVRCVVEKDGRLSNISVAKDGGYPDAGLAAVKVVERMPRWNPAYQGARPVRVWLHIPIKIRLN